jgi:hypothetical protein
LGLKQWEIPFAPILGLAPGSPAPALTQPILGPGGRIFVGAGQATFAFDASGRMLWRAGAGASHLAVSSKYLFAAADNGDLSRITFNGAVTAQTNLDAFITIKTIGITPEGNVLVSADFDFQNPRIVCFNDSLEELWSRNLSATSFAIRRDGFVLTSGWEISLLDTSGNLYWSKRSESNPPYSVGSAASTNLFFVFERDSNQSTRFSAYAADGSVRWSRPVSGLGSAVAMEDGSVIAAAASGNLVVLSRFDSQGAKIWETSIPGSGELSYAWAEPNIVVDTLGHLYLTAQSLTVLSVDGAPANSGWPMWAGDWRNRGASEPLPGTSVPAELGISLDFNGDSLLLSVSVPPQTAWTLQSSTNLVDWSDFGSQTNSIIISASSLRGNEFYRVLKK